MDKKVILKIIAKNTFNTLGKIFAKLAEEINQEKKEKNCGEE